MISTMIHWCFHIFCWWSCYSCCFHRRWFFCWHLLLLLLYLKAKEMSEKCPETLPFISFVVTDTEAAFSISSTGCCPFPHSLIHFGPRRCSEDALLQVFFPMCLFSLERGHMNDCHKISREMRKLYRKFTRVMDNPQLQEGTQKIFEPIPVKNL